MGDKRYIWIRNLATCCLCGNLLYWIFPFQPIVWRVSLVLISLYVIFKQGNRLLCEKAVLVFAVFNLIHFFISSIWQTPSTTQIGNILCVLLPICLFSYLAEKGVVTERYISVVGIVLLASSVCYYYHERIDILNYLELDEDVDITNNATSVFLFLLPLLFFLKNNIQKWITLLVCLFFLMDGAKRGNIIAAVIPIILFVYFQLKDANHSQVKFLVICLAVAASSWVAYNWFIENDYLMGRVEKTMEGDSSGRDEIYIQAWNAWLNSDNIGHYLLGYGFDGTLSVISRRGEGLHAHNDWLEILVNYGLLGIVLYVYIFISFIKLIKKTPNTQIKMVMLSSLCIWLFKTAYSMGFTAGDMSLMMVGLGTALGKSKVGN